MSFFIQIIKVCEKLVTYFVVFLTDYKLATIRDSFKFRPSIMGKVGIWLPSLMPHPNTKVCIIENIYFALTNLEFFENLTLESWCVLEHQTLATGALVDCDLDIARANSWVVASFGYVVKASVAFTCISSIW